MVMQIETATACSVDQGVSTTNHSVMLLGAFVTEFSQYSSPSQLAYSRPSYFYKKIYLVNSIF